MKVTKRFALAAVGLSVAGALVGASVANAEPVIPSPFVSTDIPLHAVGSDTTDDVMNALSAAITFDHDSNAATPNIPRFASWNAKSTAGFDTRSAANTPAGSNCHYFGNPSGSYLEGHRPNGSGAGQKALRDAFIATGADPAAPEGTAHKSAGCLDFSRSSSAPSASNVGTLPVRGLALGIDSLAFAVKEGSSVPRSLTMTQIRGAYHCSFGQFTNSNTSVLKAVIPQAGSGTRSSWVEKMFVDGQAGSPLTVAAAETRLAAQEWACVTDRTDLQGVGFKASECTGTPQVCTLPGGVSFFQEHDLSGLTGKLVAPVSVAAWQAQAFGTSPDKRSNTLLGTLKAPAGGEVSYAIGLNPAYGDLTGTADDLILTRTVYNVVPRASLTGGGSPNADLIALLEGGSSLVCQQQSIIRKFGFAISPTCGTGPDVN